jgi:CHRD domain
LVACSTDNSGNSDAGPTVFHVSLLVSNETPPCTDAGTAATGNATVTIPADDQSVVVDVSYSGLSGPATASHIHSGTAAAPGPVVLPFNPPLTSPFTKTLTAADYVAAQGAPADFATFVTGLKAGGAGYVNVHTGACKPGEIRGEVQ